ncbi:MAG: HigA family addiction module antidote protein [Myxococcales bacterium]|nr:HigA family addiction module antidote protein [Myxococcales bacterium]MCB9708478.1 HigA family addiction module antidote protein [Myxococcales bacterium]
MLPKHRPPVTPGEILREEYLTPLGMTQSELAKRMGVGVQTVNLLVNDRRSVTAETAVRLGHVFRTSPQFWMNAQVACDLWHAQTKLATGS